MKPEQAATAVAEEAFAIIQGCVESSTDLFHDLAGFASEHDIDLGAIDPSAVASEFAPLIAAMLKEYLELAVDLQSAVF